MHERLKELRKKLGLKQREFAAKIGVTTGAIGGWESGTTFPGDARISVICNTFNVRREWLESGKGEMFVPKEEPKTKEDVLREAALALFEELSPRAQDAFLAAMAEITMKALEDKRGKSKTQPQSNPLRPERPNETLVAMRDIPGRMEG